MTLRRAATRPRADRGSLELFLSLNMDARDQFVREFLTPESGARAGAFLAEWASLDFVGGTDKFASVWGDAIQHFAEGSPPLEDAPFQESIRVWRCWRHESPMPAAPRSVFVSRGIADLCPGTLWLAIERYSSSESSMASLEGYFSEVVTRARAPRFELAFEYAQTFASTGYDGSRWRCGIIDGQVPAGDALYALMLAVAITFEVNGYRVVDDSVMEGLPTEVRALCRRRVAAARRDGKRAAPHADETTHLPRWLKEWSDGRRDFVGEPSAVGFDARKHAG